MRYTRIEKYIATAAQKALDDVAARCEAGGLVNVADLDQDAIERIIRTELIAARLYVTDDQVEAPVEEARAEFVRQVAIAHYDQPPYDNDRTIWENAERLADEGVRRGLIGPLGTKKPVDVDKLATDIISTINEAINDGEQGAPVTEVGPVAVHKRVVELLKARD